MRVSTLILSLSVLLAGTAPLVAHAEEDASAVEQARQDGRDIGQGTRDTAIKVGDGVQTTATEVGHGIRDTAIEVGHGVSNAAHVVGAGFKSGWNALTGKNDDPK
jgi:hypothetical protein